MMRVGIRASVVELMPRLPQGLYPIAYILPVESNAIVNLFPDATATIVLPFATDINIGVVCTVVAVFPI